MERVVSNHFIVVPQFVFDDTRIWFKAIQLTAETDGTIVWTRGRVTNLKLRFPRSDSGLSQRSCVKQRRYIKCLIARMHKPTLIEHLPCIQLH